MQIFLKIKTFFIDPPTVESLATALYLLSINFVRVLIVYFQNIVYSCITINFTVSYVKIALIITFHAGEITIYTLLLYMNLHVPVLFIPHVLNANTDTLSYAVRDQNFLREGKRGKTLS